MRVPAKHVRKVPIRPAAFEAAIGDRIEVHVPGTTGVPGGWSLGRVKLIKSAFYFISLDGETHDMIVENDSIRPFTGPEYVLNLTGYFREEMRIPNQSVPWAKSEQGREVFGQVCEKTGALFIKYEKSDNLVIVGTKQAVIKSKLLLEVHVHHQSRLNQMKPRARVAAPTVAPGGGAGANSIQFEIPDELVGLMIGKKGAHIQRVSKEHKVDIRVVDIPSDPAKKLVRITGQPTETMLAAKDELMPVVKRYAIGNPELIGLVLGKQKSNLDEIIQKAGLFKAFLVTSTNEIELIGVKDSVENAILLLDSHIEYYTQFNELAGGKPHARNSPPPSADRISSRPSTASTRRRQ